MTAPTVTTGKDVLAYLRRVNGEQVSMHAIFQNVAHGEGVIRLALAELVLTGQAIRIGSQTPVKYCVPTNFAQMAERRINSNYGTPPMKIERRRAEIYEELAKARASTPSRHIPEVV